MARLRVRLVSQADLTPEDDIRIARLLDSAFPERPGVYVDASYWGAKPDHRLWLEDPDDADGPILAHLDLERRVVGVGDSDVLVAGVGGVAVAPALQGRGLGRILDDELFKLLLGPLPAAFGLVRCGPAVVGFFESVGWTRLGVPCRFTDPETDRSTVDDGPVLILPALSPITAWPPGPVDLRGPPW